MDTLKRTRRILKTIRRSKKIEKKNKQKNLHAKRNERESIWGRRRNALSLSPDTTNYQKITRGREEPLKCRNYHHARQLKRRKITRKKALTCEKPLENTIGVRNTQ